MMEKSKDLFLMIREQEVATSNSLPTKREIRKSSKAFAEKLMESGNHNPQEIYAQARRLKEAIFTIEAALKSGLDQESFEAFGLTGKFRSGGNTINVEEDPVYVALKKDVDERMRLLKMAQKQETLDTGGNVVPKVSTTPRKPTIAVYF